MKSISDRNIDRLREITELPDLDGTNYSVEREIDRGGMGVVYLAYDSKLKRQVAIKVLTTALLVPSMADRMMREAQVIAGLEHPGIIPVHDCGLLPDGRVFYVMKFVRGQRLDQYTQSLDSIFDRLRLFLKACEAVAFAHAAGVIHRDLKPENIMVGPFGEVLVMDWGTAKIAKTAAERTEANTADIRSELTHGETSRACSQEIDEKRKTTQSVIMGTPSYMAPEQALGSENVDERSDVYSLGAILYFMLTGRPPFEATNLDEPTATWHQTLIRPRSVNKSVVKPLEAICLRALQWTPASRYATVDAMAQDISRFLDGKSISAYRENIFERTDRWLATNRFLVLLVLAYLLMRIILVFV